MAKKIKFFCSLQKKESKKQGRWSPEEQDRFLRGCYFFKNDWEKIKDYIKTRTIPQIRSHAQKYLIKICRRYSIKLSKKKFSNRLSKHLDITKIPYKGKKNISNMSIYEKNILEMFNYYNREVIDDDKVPMEKNNSKSHLKKIEEVDNNENSINNTAQNSLNVIKLNKSSDKNISKDLKEQEIKNENFFIDFKNNNNLFSSINSQNSLPMLFPQNVLPNIQIIKPNNFPYISQNSNIQFNNPFFNSNISDFNFQRNQCRDFIHEINLMNIFNQNKYLIQNENEFYLMQKIIYYNTLLLNTIKSTEKTNENIFMMLGFNPNNNINGSFVNNNNNSNS